MVKKVVMAYNPAVTHKINGKVVTVEEVIKHLAEKRKKQKTA